MKSARVVARSLNCITEARSRGSREPRKRLAAARAASILPSDSMEAEASIISTMEIGRSSWVNSDSSCFRPSSKTEKSLRSSAVT